MDSMETERRLQALEDTQAVDRLQKIFGYYLDNGQNQKVVDLFSDNAESIEIADRGVCKGKEGIRKFFLDFLGEGRHGDMKEVPTGRMLFHMQLQGVVDVAPDGKTARGRWYMLMIQAWPINPGEPNKSVIGHGVYENEFIKEDGIWKFSKVFMSLHFRSPIPEGWVTLPVVSSGKFSMSDLPPTAYHPYPNLQIVPFHWKHPVTGEP